MTNAISFMSANYVCRQIGYQVPQGADGTTDWWGPADAATQDHFRPPESFEERFEEVIADISGAGFDLVDLWLGHLNPEWATDSHISDANAVLERQGVKVASLAGGFGETTDEFTRSCELASAVGAPVLAGFAPILQHERRFVLDTLDSHELKLGLENHPEKNPAEVRELIGAPTDGRVGSTLDTGWFGTQGYDAAVAAKELADAIVYVHLKDVLAPNRHDSCRFGDGVVPLEDVVRNLLDGGYDGTLCIEHEPEDRDPMPDVIASRDMVIGWMASA